MHLEVSPDGMRKLFERAIISAIERFQVEPRLRSSERMYALAEELSANPTEDPGPEKVSELISAHVEALMLAKLADRFLTGLLLNMPQISPEARTAFSNIVDSMGEMADHCVRDLSEAYKTQADTAREKREAERN